MQLWPIQCLVKIVIQHTVHTNINNSHEVHMVVLDIRGTNKAVRTAV